jgi:hypothetical protein
MINSLKRKKPATASTTKNAAKKTRTVPNKPIKATTQSPVAANNNQSPQSLEHLIDRPYVVYNSEEDDISKEPH